MSRGIGALVCKELYAAGCDAVVIESKRFPKVNSLIPDKMVLSSPEEFARMINKVKSVVPEMEVIARLEYLAMTKDVDQTCRIARRMVSAVADSIVIHWGGNAETSLLLEALGILKAEGISTGVIPTQFLDQVLPEDLKVLLT